jgi:CheY-like chemotaxis protein
VKVLTKAGYAVEAATTGAQAQALGRARAFDAITLDLLLPDMSGLEVLRAIRAEGKNREVPVLVITVVTDAGAMAGFAVDDFLCKPLDGAALLASLRRARILPEQPGTVLVVDDDPAALTLMSATLAQLGYRVSCAADGEEGLRAARAAAPVGLVLDLLMPGMDGFAFLEHFRQLPGCALTPVIIWTIKDLAAGEWARLRASAQAVVAKGGPGGGAVVQELETFLAMKKARPEKETH